jgi:hypothetical protein
MRAGVSFGGGNVTSSCAIVSAGLGCTAYLETLSIPLLDFTDAGHLVETVRQAIELDDTMAQSDREFL